MVNVTQKEIQTDISYLLTGLTLVFYLRCMFESDLSKVLVSEKAGFAVIVSSVCLTDSFGCLPS